MEMSIVKTVFPETWDKPEGATGYCYVTYCVDTEEFYIGKKQAKTFRSNYYGSGIVPKQWLEKGYKLEHWPISWAQHNITLSLQEQQLIKIARGFVDNVNIDPGTGPSMLGRHHSEETKQKMREAALKIKHGPMSQETKDRISASNKGKHFKTAEERKAIGDARRGRKMSEEFCRHIGDSKRGEKNPNYGKPRDEETRRKISEAQKGRKFSEEHKEKLRQARRAYLEKQKLA